MAGASQQPSLPSFRPLLLFTAPSPHAKHTELNGASSAPQHTPLHTHTRIFTHLTSHALRCTHLLQILSSQCPHCLTHPRQVLGYFLICISEVISTGRVLAASPCTPLPELGTGRLLCAPTFPEHTSLRPCYKSSLGQLF